MPEQTAMAPDPFPLALPGLRGSRLLRQNAATESEADRTGQRIAAAAGYDPAALPRWLERDAAPTIEPSVRTSTWKYRTERVLP